mmetsp:Transcript_24438/g.43437  ORF Transcript_24438/g.43437 Transcript_24438/m.43437 type:complete len:106 (+) Transcript_24438:428-745(+)
MNFATSSNKNFMQQNHHASKWEPRMKARKFCHSSPSSPDKVAVCQQCLELMVSIRPIKGSNDMPGTLEYPISHNIVELAPLVSIKACEFTEQPITYTLHLRHADD